MLAPEAAAGYDFLLVGGSHYSAYEDHPWIGQLAQLLQQYVELGVRVVGCCFGAQVGRGAAAAPGCSGGAACTCRASTSSRAPALALEADPARPA
jgi:hypothetical protein